MVAPFTTDKLNGLSSNGYNVSLKVDSQAKLPPISRYPSLCFEDGNLAILAEQSYFLVHWGVLSHHSSYLDQLLNPSNFDAENHLDTKHRLEGRPVFSVPESPKDMFILLSALYDGLSTIHEEANDFQTLTVLLRLSAKYQTTRLRLETVTLLLKSWPLTLDQWDHKEAGTSSTSRLFSLNDSPLNPIMIINLAREVDVLQLLPSAFYDLSRQLPSTIAAGFLDSSSSHHQLSHEDLVRLLQGRELASRFFSTFIVNELEGRPPSRWCYNSNADDLETKKKCQIAFENVTIELLRDVNGVVCNRTSDPLFAMGEGFNLQSNDATTVGPRLSNKYRACDACRIEFAAAVDAARQDFWNRLPEWFDVEIPAWGSSVQ